MPAPSPAPEAPSDGVTAGMLLRQAREAAGLHVATLAATLKVPVRKLEALEEDRYDELPDAVFVRALASSICRTLKVDPHPVLDRLPQTAQPRLVPQENTGLNAPFRAPGDGPNPGWADQLTRPVALTVVALLLGALVLIFLPVAQRGVQTAKQAGGSEPVMPPANAPVPADARPVDTPAPSSESPVPSTTTVAAAPAAAPAASTAPAPATAGAATAAATPAAGAAARAASSAAAPATASASAPAAVATGVVVFRTRGPSWIEVTDASGKTVLRKLMAAGESAGANGSLPLQVTVGSVEQTDVVVRGKPYNLAPVSRDNVARFQVQ
jgi:cytoskeleton protein RodZ